MEFNGDLYFIQTNCTIIASIVPLVEIIHELYVYCTEYVFLLKVSQETKETMKISSGNDRSL